jgi:hypothetical protein
LTGSRRGEQAFDDVNCNELDVVKVRTARSVEMKFVQDQKIWKYGSKAERLQVTGRAPAKTMWLDANKGDDENEVYRSQLDAKEFKKSWLETAFAGTPPLETFRALTLLRSVSATSLGGATTRGPEVQRAGRVRRAAQDHVRLS